MVNGHRGGYRLLVFFFVCAGDNQDLPVLTHSFPNRRASGLVRTSGARLSGAISRGPSAARASSSANPSASARPAGPAHRASPQSAIERSEEHTSELQSLMRTSYAVFCLKQKISTTSNSFSPVSTFIKTLLIPELYDHN